MKIDNVNRKNTMNTLFRCIFDQHSTNWKSLDEQVLEEPEPNDHVTVVMTGICWSSDTQSAERQSVVFEIESSDSRCPIWVPYSSAVGLELVQAEQMVQRQTNNTP